MPRRKEGKFAFSFEDRHRRGLGEANAYHPRSAQINVETKPRTYTLGLRKRLVRYTAKYEYYLSAMRQTIFRHQHYPALHPRVYERLEKPKWRMVPSLDRPRSSVENIVEHTVRHQIRNRGQTEACRMS